MQKSSLKILRIFLFCSVLLALAVNASALQTEVNGAAPDEVKEGEIVDITLVITGIPPAADYISIDSDLEKNGTDPIYEFEDLNVTSYSNDFQLPLNETTSSLTVHVKGRTPVIKEVKQLDGVTLVKFDPKRTGYAYYRIKFTDENSNPLKESDTRTFSINVPEITSFEEKLNTIEDPFLRNYLRGLYEKGLNAEANELADYLNSADEGRTVPLLWVIIGFVAVGVVGFVIGIRKGNSEEEEEE
jgi:hypothetical protein